jgi:hypothetical protein
MTSADSTIENMGNQKSRHSRKGGFCGKGNCAKGNWSGINIAAMVIGFILFWPLGLVVLYWNITGRNIKDLPPAIQEKWNAVFSGVKNHKDSDGGNSVFDEFQQTQYDRIHEIKEEIKSRASSFRIFKSDAKRQADEVEFKDFMSSDRSQDDK